MANGIRIGVIAVAALFLLGSLAVVAAGGPEAVTGIVWAIGAGVVIVVVVLERTRYRSEAAEGRDDPGPGGGERGMPEPRFRPTNEVFVDPTTRRLMRVWVDARTGERRYVAEA